MISMPPPPWLTNWYRICWLKTTKLLLLLNEVFHLSSRKNWWIIAKILRFGINLLFKIWFDLVWNSTQKVKIRTCKKSIYEENFILLPRIFSWKRKWQISRFPPQSENCVFFKKEYLFQKNRWKFMKLMFCRGESCCVDPLGWWFVKKITLH